MEQKLKKCLSSSFSEHKFEVFEIVDGIRHTLHVTSSKLDAIKFALKYSDCCPLYIEENLSASLVFDLNKFPYDC